jgi:hypothetical protein
MYYRDHAPPHFHAIYGEQEDVVEIDTATIVEGALPRRAASLVSEWATANRSALQDAWNLARAAEPLPVIPGLD